MVYLIASAIILCAIFIPYGIHKKNEQKRLQQIRNTYGIPKEEPEQKPENKPQMPFVKKKCPRCSGQNYHAVIVKNSKDVTRTKLNLNPLHPFTVYNNVTKNKKEVVKFVCDDCGTIFDCE